MLKSAKITSALQRKCVISEKIRWGPGAPGLLPWIRNWLLSFSEYERRVTFHPAGMIAVSRSSADIRETLDGVFDFFGPLKILSRAPRNFKKVVTSSWCSQLFDTKTANERKTWSACRRLGPSIRLTEQCGDRVRCNRPCFVMRLSMINDVVKFPNS